MKKIQLYVDEKKDEAVYGLIERLESEANNTRGFVQDQIKERLKAFEMLCKRIGSNDPMEVVMKYVEGIYQPPVIDQQPQHSAPGSSELADISTKNNAMKFVDAAKNNFNFD